MKQQYTSNWLPALLALTLAIVYILPRLPALGHYVGADEPMFAKLGGHFYYAVANRDWAATEQGNHPGVTFLWAGAAGYWLQFPEYRKLGAAVMADGHFHNLLLRHGQNQLLLLRAERLVVILLHAALLVLVFLYLCRLLGTVLALFGSLLLAFDPFYFAYSRFVHSEAFLAETMLLSVLAFLVYRREGARGHLLASGVFAGLACLSKTPGLFLAPIIATLALPVLWQTDAGKAARRGLRLAAVLGAWALAGMFTFVALYPAMWVDPFGVLQRLLNFTFESRVGEHLSTVYFNGQLFGDGAIGPGIWYFYPLHYLWRATPITVPGLALAVFFALRGPLPNIQRTVLRVLLAYPLFYILILNFSVKKFDRYLVAVHPPLALAAALGWLALFAWLASRWPQMKSRAAARLAGAVLVAVHALPLVQSAPYYLTYYNPLMGGAEKAPEVLMIGWGEGLDEAARYLNQIPDIEESVVYSWYAQVFNYHFNGIAHDIRIHALTEQDLANALAADYIVTYTHTWQRRSGPTLLDILEPLEPIHRITIQGIEYAQIYRLQP